MIEFQPVSAVTQLGEFIDAIHARIASAIAIPSHILHGKESAILARCGFCNYPRRVDIMRPVKIYGAPRFICRCCGVPMAAWPDADGVVFCVETWD